MKLLFFVGNLYKTLNATNKIAFELAEHLSECGDEILLFGANFDEEFSYPVNDRFSVVSITPDDIYASARKTLEAYLKKQNKSRGEAVKLFSLRHPVTALRVNHSYSNKYTGMEDICRRYIDNNFEKNGFDYIVCFQEPAWAEKVMIESKITDSKKIIYQTDPYGMHQLCSEEQRSVQEKQELENFERVKHIFTTTLLEKEYRKHEKYSAFSEKITGAEFPNIRPPHTAKKSPVQFAREDTNIVFCGMLDDSYRSPEGFFSAFSPLFESMPYVKFHFWGNITSRSIYTFAEKYPDNIFIHQPVDSETAAAIQNDADFLLNIGNSVSNQVPSKIFDYFSLGKPIINIQKIENCPARDYFDRYPLVCNFEEYAPDITELSEFIRHAKGRTVSFDKVRQIYHTATTEYVAGLLKNILSD